MADTLRELGTCVRAAGGREEEAKRYFKLASQQIEKGNLHPLARWISGAVGSHKGRGEIGYPTEDEHPAVKPPPPPYASEDTHLSLVARLAGSTE